MKPQISIMSKVDEAKHILVFDYDDLDLESVKVDVRELIKKYQLSHCYIVEKKEGSHGVICLDVFSLDEAIKIHKDSREHKEFNEAPLKMPERSWGFRISAKKGQKMPKPICIIESPYDLRIASLLHWKLLNKIYGFDLKYKALKNVGLGWYKWQEDL